MCLHLLSLSTVLTSIEFISIKWHENMKFPLALERNEIWTNAQHNATLNDNHNGKCNISLSQHMNEYQMLSTIGRA